jgi:hypothetical protein
MISGHHIGACKYIEDAFGQKMAQCACGHHYIERIENDAYRLVEGKTKGPEESFAKGGFHDQADSVKN